MKHSRDGCFCGQSYIYGSIARHRRWLRSTLLHWFKDRCCSSSRRFKRLLNDLNCRLLCFGTLIALALDQRMDRTTRDRIRNPGLSVKDNLYYTIDACINHSLNVDLLHKKDGLDCILRCRKLCDVFLYSCNVSLHVCSIGV